MHKKDQRTKEEYQTWLGRTVMKISKKPFKSGEKLGIPIDIVINPQSPKQALGFRMKDDDSIVDCSQCQLVK